MHGSSLTISYFTFQEAIRNRLFIFTLLILVSLFGFMEFMGEIVITERRELQSASLGFILRLFAIFIVSLFVITSMVREFNDKGFELVLSLPIQRWSYYLGKFIGFALLAVIITVIISLPLLIYADFTQVVYWSVSLLCELMIMISVSLLCLFTFGNITIAFSIVTTFYILSRSISAIKLISESPILEINSVSQNFMNYMVKGIAAVLPDFNLFTQSEWLIYGGANLNSLLIIFGQTIIFVVLLSAAALFDLYRKNL